MVNMFLWLLALCIAMFVGSFLFGSIPLSAKFSDSKLRHLTAIGVGLLLGTALIVIIPEGIETLYGATNTLSHTLDHVPNVNLVATPLPFADPVPTALNDTSDTASIKGNPPLENREPHDDAEDEEGFEHFAIGASLITGFALMFVVDQLGSLHVHASPHGEVNELTTVRPESPFTLDATEDEAVHQTYHSRSSASRSMTPTIGLIVHATADGIALGASASQPKLSMVVFIAIMLHKAPSAFALTTVLLAEELSRVRVRQHLLMFSLAAPSGAIITYLLLNVFSSTAESSAGGQLAYWTGILLVFSGGTFLYVAMHALQELQPSVSTPSSSLAHPDKLSTSQVACILGGMLLPILLNVQHSH